MRAVIFANGHYENLEVYRSLVRDGDLLVCADGGANTAVRLGLRPSAVVGDLDSADPGVIERLQADGVKIERHPAEKDATDLELALDYAVRSGADGIIVCGALGGRIDQELANIGLLLSARMAGVSCRIMESACEIFVMRRYGSIKGNPGDTVSLLPVGQAAEGTTLSGFKYPLVDRELSLGTTLGISNVLAREEARVEMRSGTLLVVISKGGGGANRGD
ncbi:MAG: thiamine diphosphokinase [Chloroflexi bacterium]|nr:thiamine diphosphokinase [Chloroflexota bacterium]